MNRVANNRKDFEEDEKDRVLAKLRSINFRLRKKLKYLNEKVEKAIDRTETKRILASRKKQPINVAHQMKVKEKEIENAEQQYGAYQREIKSLQAKIEEISQVGKMLEMEQETREHKQAISDLKKAVKDKELILENLAKTDDPSYKISNMINEIRMWKEKIQNREALYERNESTVAMQDDKMAEIEKENEELMSKIQQLDSNIQLEPRKGRNQDIGNAMEKAQEEIKNAEEKYETIRKTKEKELKLAQKKLNEKKAERDEFYRKAKELDQEHRISTLKLREVGRMLKHNQLNPLVPIRGNHNLTSRRSAVGSKKSMSKRSSVADLHSATKKKNKPLGVPEKKLSRGGNAQSTQLLHKKQYSKPNDDSDEDFEKNQVIDFDKKKKVKN